MYRGRADLWINGHRREVDVVAKSDYDEALKLLIELADLLSSFSPRGELNTSVIRVRTLVKEQRP